MNVVQRRQYEMLVRVSGFGDARGDLFPRSTLGGQAFAALAATVAELNDHAIAKMSWYSAARDGAGRRAVARTALRRRLVAISRTARVIAKHAPDMKDRFLRPDVQTDQALLTAGRLFRRDGKIFKDAFVAHAMPKSVFAELDVAIDTFEQAIRVRNTGKGQYSAAHARIETALEAGMEAVRTLDVIVANRLREDQATMTVWKHDRRVEYPNRVKRAPLEDGIISA